MIFSDEFIEKVREANPLEEVVGNYVKLERKGFRSWGLCPFHSEKSASFQVDNGRQFYHCFGCGASGDVFTFLMEYDKMNFSEAVTALANRAGIPLPEYRYDPQKKREADERQVLLDIHREAAKFFYYRLKSEAGKNALAYLDKRGIGENTIKDFAIGYADRAGNTLYEYLKSRDYTDAQLIASGLIVFNETKTSVHDKFWNRVMFPIMDVNRRVIAFGGRVLGEGKPKYLNSPETKLFDKSKNLYGLYAAKNTKRGSIMLCEGYMDVISLHQAGFTNAAASLGTALTSQQAALLRRYTKEVLLLYDSDEAGVKAAIKAVSLLRHAGVAVKVVNLHPFKDPDDLVKIAGADELEKRIRDAENGFLFSIRKFGEKLELGDPQNFSDFLHEIARRLSGIEDEIERNSYKSSVCRMYNINEQLMDKQIARLFMQGYRPERIEGEFETMPKKKKGISADKAERQLLSWISRDPGIWDELKNDLSEEDFSEGINKKIAAAMFERFGNENYAPAAILNRFEDADEKAEAAAVLEDCELPEDKADVNRAVRELLFVIKSRSLERRLEEMNTGSVEQLQLLMQEKRKLEELKGIL